MALSVGFAILAHQRLDRAAALASHLVQKGNPVAVHLDARVPFRDVNQFRKAVGPEVDVIQKYRAEWGKFGLVDATLSLVEHLLQQPERQTHVCLLSGSCLPLRSVPELQSFLDDHPDRDFIESVPVSEDDWVEDGLSLERFTLFHPFSHRHHPKLFSNCVDVQRKLGIRRRIPRGLEPHLGMQWWCLSVKTLQAIVDHPRLPAWRAFFAKSWIPDESFFQTLVRAVRPDDAPGPALHLNRFNTKGRPSVFHDDHWELLAASDYFFARKIDPDADGLYAHFLGEGAQTISSGFEGKIDEAPFQASRTRDGHEGEGILHQSRMPRASRLTYTQTATPYLVLIGEDAGLLHAAQLALPRAAQELAIHGRLFAKDAPAEFENGQEMLAGNLMPDPAFRDYRASQFLARVLWADRPRRTVFSLLSGDDDPIRVQLCEDPNARLVLLMGDPCARVMLDALRRPLPPNKPPPWWRIRRRKGRTSTLRAWHRCIHPDGLEEGGSGELESVVLSDWADAAGWTVPA